jgi:hypothetical protein
MPPVAAFGAAIASSVTLTGLAAGAAIIGTGMQAIGMVTGSKTLQKIGTGFSMAGGVGMGASALSGMNASRVTGGGSKSMGILQTDNIDEMLSTSIKGKSGGLSTFNPSKADTSSMNNFQSASKGIGSNQAGMTNFDPEIEKNFFQRANDTLTKHNSLLNIAGGMGEAYMVNERMDLERELLDKKLGFEQQLVDRVNTNNGTPLNINPSFNLNRDPRAYTGILGR